MRSVTQSPSTWLRQCCAASVGAVARRPPQNGPIKKAPPMASRKHRWVYVPGRLPIPFQELPGRSQGGDDDVRLREATLVVRMLVGLPGPAGHDGPRSLRSRRCHDARCSCVWWWWCQLLLLLLLLLLLVCGIPVEPVQSVSVCVCVCVSVCVRNARYMWWKGVEVAS